MTVTVLLITYNHERFIRQAIDGVLAQRGCDYELVIVEDCSTDRTREFVLEYYSKHPSKIRLSLAPTNQFSTKAWADALEQSSGRYIALLDGDDFWTSPDKLRKQVEFLDAHPECAICFHNTLKFHDGRMDQGWKSNGPSQKTISTIDDLWVGNFIPTCSVMFRRGLFGPVPTWYESMLMSADWALHLLNARHGSIGYIDEVMAAYRQHTGGVWTRLTGVQQILRVIDFYERMDVNFEFAYRPAIDTALHEKGGILLSETRSAFKKRDLREAFRGTVGLLRHFPYHLAAQVRPSYRPLMLRKYPAVCRAVGTSFRAVANLAIGRKSDAHIEGGVETVERQQVFGWAWDVSHPDAYLEIEVWEGDTLVAKSRADRFRRELLARNIGNGYHAFACRLPQQWQDGRPHTFRVRAGGRELSGSPIRVTA